MPILDGLCVLVVDDMSTARKILKRYCTELGCANIHEAENGLRGVEVLSTLNPLPDIIISDWMMPKLTGIDFLRKVRGDARTSKVPFVMVTAENEKKQLGEVIQAGVSGYLSKPYSKKDLEAKITSVLSRS